MLATVIEVAERRWAEARHPRKLLARAIMQLHGSLDNCQEAYSEFLRDRSQRSLDRWAVAIEALVATLLRVQPVLRIYDEALTQRLNEYLSSEHRSLRAADPEAGIRDGISQIEDVGSADNTAVESASQPTAVAGDPDFAPALARLREFIREHFTPDEMFV